MAYDFDEGFFGLLVFLFIGLVALAAGLNARRLYLRRLAVWREFALMKGLQFVEASAGAPAKMIGVREGKSLEIAVRSAGRGKSRYYFTEFRVELTGELPSGLGLRRENPLSGVGKLFGAKDFRTGFEDLDQVAMIRGDAPEGVIEYFSDERVRRAAIDFLALSPLNRVENGAVMLRVRRLVEDESDLQQWLDKAVAAACGMSVR